MVAWNVTAVVSTNFIEHSQDKLPFQNKDTAEISLVTVQFSQQTLDLERKNIINKKIQEECIVQEDVRNGNSNHVHLLTPNTSYNYIIACKNIRAFNYGTCVSLVTSCKIVRLVYSFSQDKRQYFNNCLPRRSDKPLHLINTCIWKYKARTSTTT